jgi:hypothetical protein
MQDLMAHGAAKEGDWDLLRVIGHTNPEWLDLEDDNGWRPIHEAGKSPPQETLFLTK